MKTLICLVLLLAAQSVNAADQPPENIIKHYEWCLLPKYRPDAIARMEAFYAKRHPKDEQYEDAIHIRFVRLSAFRLVELYAADRNMEKVKYYLKWIQDTDPATAK
jgi:hypothetical protein